MICCCSSCSLGKQAAREECSEDGGRSRGEGRRHHRRRPRGRSWGRGRRARCRDDGGDARDGHGGARHARAGEGADDARVKASRRGSRGEGRGGARGGEAGHGRGCRGAGGEEAAAAGGGQEVVHGHLRRLDAWRERERETRGDEGGARSIGDLSHHEEAFGSNRRLNLRGKRQTAHQR